MDTILAHGAEGSCVPQLTALARAAGIDVPQLAAQGEKLGHDVIDTILSNLGLAEQDVRHIAGDVQGAVVDQQIWDALKQKAAATTGLHVPTQAAAGVESVAGSGEQQAAASTGTEQFPPAPEAGGAQA